MAREDKTGFENTSPGTGWCADYCADCSLPCPMRLFIGRSGAANRQGRRRRGGWNKRYWAFAGFPFRGSYSKAREKEDLQNQLKMMEEEMATLKERLNEIEKESAEGS